MNTIKLSMLLVTLIVSGSVFSQDAAQQGLETNLSNIIYCKELVLVDDAIVPSLITTDVQQCEQAYEKLTGMIAEDLSELRLAETEHNARVLVASSYMTQGDNRYYMKDFSEFPLQIKARELPRCRRICNHFANL